MVIHIRRSVVVICITAILVTFLSLTLVSAYVVPKKENKVYLPILMYHHFLPESGHLGTYVITPQEFEGDLRYLLSRGYTAVNISDIIAYVENGTLLPDKPFMITVDDGYYSFYKYIFPILQRYSCKAILSPIIYFTELYSETKESNPIYTHVTFDQIKEMNSSGLVEFGNHSYNMHSLEKRHGIKKLKNESNEIYIEKLTCDINLAQTVLSANTGITPKVYAYPFGYYSKVSDGLIKKLGFKASFICEEKVNCLSDDPICLFNLGRFNRPHGMNFSAQWNKIELKIN